MRIFLLLLVSFVIPWAEAEESAYVTDRLEVYLRAGKGIKYKILRQVRSGTPLTVLAKDPKSGYSRVRLRDGTEGWILTRYLSPEPSARWQLKQAREKLERLSRENARLKEELETLKSQQGSLTTEKQNLTRRSAQLEAELQQIRHAAAHAMEIQEERNRLRGRVAELERRLHQLQLENQALSHDRSQRWFLIGAGVLAGGILAGLLLPRLTWRRRRGWDSLNSL